MNVCELGFVEKPENPSHLTSPFFPSKLGGKPAWLDPLDIPLPEALSCGNCSRPLTFLLQVYAPLSDGSDDSTFHRALFLFMCLDPNCHQRQENVSQCFKVLRCQLPKRNGFYPDPEDSLATEVSVCEEFEQLKLNAFVTKDLCEPNISLPDAPGSKYTVSAPQRSKSSRTLDSEEVKPKPVAATQTISPATSSQKELTTLCIVCGVRGTKRCAKCQLVCYCSKEHQVHDWRSGHKLFCSDLARGRSSLTDVRYDPSVGAVLPLMEIVTELEPDGPSLENKSERNDEERMADYREFVQSRNIDVCKSVAIKKAKYPEATDKVDRQFKAFRKRVAIEPEQVCPFIAACLVPISQRDASVFES